MDQLLTRSHSQDLYDFTRVQRFDNKIDGGLLSLHELYIPINAQNNHWNFVWIKLTTKQIEMWDSMGIRKNKKSHDNFLEVCRRYMYDALHKRVEEFKPPYESWKHNWSLVDQSRQSPRQINDVDCGVFTLTSMGLLRNGANLCRESYSQQFLLDNQSRRRLAWRIWQSGLEEKDIQWHPQL